MMKIYKLLV